MPDHGSDDFARRIALVMALRGAGVRNTHVLSAIEQVPRDAFVDAAFRDQAYEDIALPIALGQTISQPTVVACMTEALELSPRHTVLEIGTGSGYQAAVLSRLARRVYTIERHRELLRQAVSRFEALGYTNIVTRAGDGARGWKEAAPFDRIIATAAPQEVPEALLEQLREGGILVLPVGMPSGGQVLLRIRKDEQGHLTREELMAVKFVPLIEG